MSNKTDNGNGPQSPPALERDAGGRVEPASLAGLIQWFLDYDERVAVVRFPVVEALFQWKQQETMREQPDSVGFNSAEDRLAIGVMQALVSNDTERELHAWLRELLGALDDATKTNEAIAESYGLKPGEESSPVEESEKIPSRREREVYLTCCWLETLCTAEIRVLGWAYKELYGRPFHPENF
ncbi:MAG TPA: hypothetical protein VK422_22385 [Pyrinomonadaceae bacterium]|nr:hypothetical protein [Pyrinomonadaceae bacterium]